MSEAKVGEQTERGRLKRSFTLFLAFVLVYTAIGVPAYIFYQRRRAEQIAAETEREREQERAGTERNERQALEETVRVPGATPSGIRGPNADKQPPASLTQPSSVYDYLPVEQRRMLQPGQGPGARRPR
jgi:hypothetical protein